MAQQAVKLYTKEMFLQAAEKCEVSMIDVKHITKYIDEYVTPIKLPTDEEISQLNPFRLGGGNYNGSAAYQWQKGVKWLRDKILNK